MSGIVKLAGVWMMFPAGMALIAIIVVMAVAAAVALARYWICVRPFGGSLLRVDSRRVRRCLRKLRYNQRKFWRQAGLCVTAAEGKQKYDATPRVQAFEEFPTGFSLEVEPASLPAKLYRDGCRPQSGEDMIRGSSLIASAIGRITGYPDIRVVVEPCQRNVTCVSISVWFTDVK